MSMDERGFIYLIFYFIQVKFTNIVCRAEAEALLALNLSIWPYGFIQKLVYNCRTWLLITESVKPVGMVRSVLALEPCEHFKWIYSESTGEKLLSQKHCCAKCWGGGERSLP
jgi:hypothetical protein